MLNHCGTKNIESERLLLRQFSYSDADHMLTNWISDPEVQKLISEPIYQTKDEVHLLLNKWIGSYDNSDYYRWAVIEKDSNICIGQLAIYLVDNKNHFCEIEYALGQKFHRKGYATEAVKRLLEFAFNEIGFNKVQVSHKEGNAASQGVILKNQFTYEGTLRDYFFMDNKYVSRLFYSMLKSEYEMINR